MAAVGQTLQNRYRILALLGQGGMGAVYRAWDLRLNIPVALKEMVPQPGIDPQALAQLRHQFYQEAQVLARLNHPNLVRVTDYFEEGGNAYLAMDFVEGQSLADLIAARGPLPEAPVLEWARQLLDALAYCHAQGVVHRDIKPQNIIITPSPAPGEGRGGSRAVLVDFGLVKLWDPRDPRTRTVVRAMGTPEYAPPEQYGMAGHTDPRSDLYSLGATLYHALTGQPPLSAAERIARPEQFRLLRALAPGVSLRTGAAIMRAMELTASARFGNAAEMKAALAGGMATQPLFSTSPKIRPASPALTSPSRPSSAWLGLWMAGAVLLVLIVFLLLNFRQQATSPSPTFTPSPTPTASPTPMPPLTLTGPADNAVFTYGQKIVLTWSGPSLTDRQRFVVKIDGIEWEQRGPIPGPTISFTLPQQLAAGTYTWMVRLEEEREGKWKEILRSEERHFRVVEPSPLPQVSPSPSPSPSPPPQDGGGGGGGGETVPPTPTKEQER